MATAFSPHAPTSPSPAPARPSGRRRIPARANATSATLVTLSSARANPLFETESTPPNSLLRSPVSSFLTTGASTSWPSSLTPRTV